jgi:glycosyltransferase involved in cell wall biosynthesis
VVNWVLKSSDAVVAQSTNTRENTHKYYSYDGPIEIIPLGIRQPDFADATRDDLGVPRDRFVAITVGRLVKRKGIDQLLQALTLPECQDAILYVVGDGPERAPLTTLSRELGLEDRVVFTGRVEEDEKWQLLKCSDAYVSATLHEGFGLVYLEGMAAGLPVVTFDHGGQVDFLRHDETGYVVSAGDVPGLAAAIGRLIANPEEVERFRATNLQRAPQHRIEECADGYEELFDRVAAEGKKAATLVTA